MFCVLSRSKGCCIQKSPSFFLPASTKRRKLPRFVLCFTVRFTAFHSAVRVSLHSTALRVFHFLFAVSWVGGAAIVLGKRRGVECPLPPHAAMLDKYLAFVTMSMSAACLSWATICIAPCDCCFGWIRFGYWAGRGEG